MTSRFRFVASFAFSALVAWSCASGDDGQPDAPHHVDKFATGGAAGSPTVPTGGGGHATSGAAGTGNSTSGGHAGAAASGGTSTGGAGMSGSSGQGGGPAGAGQGGAAGGSGQGGSSGSSGQGGTSSLLCPVTLSFHPSTSIGTAVVAGEWENFDLAMATPMNADGSGGYVANLSLPPGLWAYKLVVDGTWELDPGQGRRKYVGSPPIENSGVKVRDCSVPALTVSSSKAARPSPNAGTYDATLAYVDGIDATGADPSGFVATIRHGGNETPLAASQVSVDASGAVTVSLSGLEDGKYVVEVTPKSKSGKVGDPLHLVFWIEAEAFSWKDAVIYMVMTDRYADADPTNDAPPLAGVDPRAAFKGGDFLGVKKAIDDGTLDALGIRAIWLSPFHTNPPDAWPAADGVHMVTGYHGYWPIKAREVEPRLGGAQALHDLVESAHAHGIRILQDFVVNHVHQEHEYFQAHPEWFRTGCVCGTNNCDWTSHALDCLFAPYLPDVNHTVAAVTQQFAEDAVWWIDTFDLDGLRIDAVKHVEEAATRNLAAEVRETFEPSGNHMFLMGETAMGWNDCADPCNDENYGTIAKYIGPFGLDGQFDFVLYHGVSYRTFAWEAKGMLHADYWFQHGETKWPATAIMTPYIGSHDTARFVTLAQYGANDGTPGNQWDNVATAPPSGDSEPYARARLGFAWLLGALPGAPLVYYGDEYGQWGGSDPNNRMMFRPESMLDSDETATLAFVRKVGSARKELVALRRGAYVPYSQTTDDTLIVGRKPDSGASALVALTRSPSAQPITVEVANALGLAPGTVLHDRLGGPDVTVATDGTATASVPAEGAVILAP